MIAIDKSHKDGIRHACQFIWGVHKHTRIPPEIRDTVLLPRVLLRLMTEFGSRNFDLCEYLIDRTTIIWGTEFGVYSWKTETTSDGGFRVI